MQIARIVKNLVERTYGKCAGLAFAFIVIWTFITPPELRAEQSKSAAANEDPWRRTAAGWELVGRWDGPNSSLQYTPFSLRFDSHPAVLALLQALSVVGAFALFPPNRENAGRVSGW